MPVTIVTHYEFQSQVFSVTCSSYLFQSPVLPVICSSLPYFQLPIPVTSVSMYMFQSSVPRNFFSSYLFQSPLFPATCSSHQCYQLLAQVQLPVPLQCSSYMSKSLASYLFKSTVYPITIRSPVFLDMCSSHQCLQFQCFQFQVSVTSVTCYVFKSPTDFSGYLFPSPVFPFNAQVYNCFQLPDPVTS